MKKKGIFLEWESLLEKMMNQEQMQDLLRSQLKEPFQN